MGIRLAPHSTQFLLCYSIPRRAVDCMFTIMSYNPLSFHGLRGGGGHTIETR